MVRAEVFVEDVLLGIHEHEKFGFSTIDLTLFFYGSCCCWHFCFCVCVAVFKYKLAKNIE